jgi:hypothetical protein
MKQKKQKANEWISACSPGVMGRAPGDDTTARQQREATASSKQQNEQQAGPPQRPGRRNVYHHSLQVHWGCDGQGWGGSIGASVSVVSSYF